ncbi:MAG: bifunctional (p)ppGpp synthetase/guanosine-3',5'-bis(diphosphate) 3'-pyrophosphohydrolase [Candidatus Moranbacteria bacterium]|nr:bifunctional (p)ppGpp synthetase/guanosine-3',5'-bis(diphosphate) 3'-pyrophosphohydrolase [Candidatus Moranbacteria bacterium]NTW75843.1 bifunctional (p)ppGpp synthetase/guanosine-3',5'-bis(diphosphate) 3'-pyrophosphohydrolase [Candidatus Moranbacteria bacterium]
MTHSSPLATLDDVLKHSRRPFSIEERRFIEDAFTFAIRAHEGQKRKSGEPYVTHSIAVTKILAEIGMDKETLAAGLLHDVPEDTEHSLAEVGKRFGSEVESLVDGITKLGKIKLRGSHEEYFLENLRKMFLAMAADIRVVIIKLADRLHNMRTLDALPPVKRERIARETMEIYAQIANRLGISEIKGELEDLSFKYLDPEHYEEMRQIEETYVREGKTYLERVIKQLRKELEGDGIKIVDIDGRTKHLYRLFRKLQKHDMEIGRVYDLVAVRILVPEIVDCYETLGSIHKRYRPLVGRIKDYISLPKPNGYQSLHTTVFGPEGRIFELQIRTPKMHDEAEYGIAAHWIYTEKERGGWRQFVFGRKSTPVVKPKEVAWIAQLKEWQKEVGRDDAEFLSGLKIEFFKNHIFAFTPKGDIIELPEEATPIDFAYAIHTEVGEHAVGAKIDGKMSSLDSVIKNGQVVEILVAKDRKKPNADWLRFVKTSTAKSKIRRAQREEDENK